MIGCVRIGCVMIGCVRIGCVRIGCVMIGYVSNLLLDHIGRYACEGTTHQLDILVGHVLQGGEKRKGKEKSRWVG